jgi:hypothetical protein
MLSATAGDFVDDDGAVSRIAAGASRTSNELIMR